MGMESPSNASDASKSDRKVLASFVPYLWPKGSSEIRIRFVLSICFLVIGKVIQVSVPFTYKDAIDKLSVPNHTELVLMPIVYYGVLRVMGSFFDEARQFVFAKVSHLGILDFNLKAYSHLHVLSLRWHLDRETGSLLRILERTKSSVQWVLQYGAFVIIPTILEIAFVSITLVVLYDFTYTAVILVTIGLYVFFTLKVTVWRNKLRRDMNEADNRANQISMDSLLNFEAVKYFAAEEFEIKRYENALRQYVVYGLKTAYSFAFLNFGQQIILALGFFTIMLRASYGVRDGVMTVGDFVLVNSFLMQLYLPLGFLGSAYRMIKQSIVDVEKVFDLLDEKIEIVDKENAIEIHGPAKTDEAVVMVGGEGGAKQVAGDEESVVDTSGIDLLANRSEDFGIKFDDVCFSYGPLPKRLQQKKKDKKGEEQEKKGASVCDDNESRVVIKGLTFDIPAGRRVAIVGQSGSGKSTISKLLFRLYDVNKGQILLNDTNISEISQGSLRQAIGIVPQDCILFNDTIRYNIEYGRPGASLQEIQEAARFSQIHEFVKSLPQGYDTMVGERGLKISGGEKQRISVARMLLKNPPVLVLDEATSSLDTKTEKEIQEALQYISKGRTSLIIAHRLSTVADCDSIIVLKDGQIAEQGTHTDLIVRQGLYYDMWQQQVAGDQTSSSESDGNGT